MLMSTLVGLSATISVGLVMIFSMMKETPNEKSMEKISFECGFMNMSASKMTFSTNFVMMIIMFLMFDIEVSIMIPMMMSSEKSNSTQKIIPLTFLSFLTMVMVKEWAQGALDWSN